jgi:signal transduction histidine kinase/DNA-binding NarL/FixJ family response regulator
MEQSLLHDSRNADTKDSVQRFQSQLAREILVSQRLRVTIMASLAGASTVFLTFVAVLKYSGLIPGYAWPPWFIPVLTAAVTVYELAMRKFVDRCISRSKAVSPGIWLAGSFLEVTTMSVMVVAALSIFESPIYGLTVPAVLVYTLLIILSTFHLDPRLSLFTGAVASGEYLTIALLTLYTYRADSGLDPLFTSSFMYISKALLLLMAGAAAALVARELSRRTLSTFTAINERDLEQQENAFKTRFLANMSHEIRTPLNAILGYAQLLAADEKLTVAQRRTLGTISASGDHLVGVINDVLDLSKIEAGRDEINASSFRLDMLTQDLASMFELSCSRKNVEWVLEAEMPEGPVYGDETKLRQVLTNLLGNAVKFTEVGKITFRVTESGPSRYTFAVEDTGPGIAPEYHALIFEPFHQEARGALAGGTGLGLAIAHRHVGLIGGHLEVTSMPGEGACFYFTVFLPAADYHPGDTGPGAWEHISGLAPGCSVDALVVDDVAQNRDVLVQALALIGIDARQAENGNQALDEIRQQTPDIIFMDIRMPGLSGVETMRRASEAVGRNELKFVAVSASALAHERSIYLEAGFDDFIEKPIRLADLYESLSKMTGVRYRYALASLPKDTNDTGWDGVVLTEPLYNALTRAMESHNITALYETIDELAALGERERNLADKLREISRGYDMRVMLEVLGAIDHE